jgi:hypothetical protein
MPMIWTAANIAFLVLVGAAILVLIVSEIIEARRARLRSRAHPEQPAAEPEPCPPEPLRIGRGPAAALRRMGID